MKTLQKIDVPCSLTEQAYLSIRRFILEGSLDTGSRLTEDFFAQRLGISKSPVREALNRLESEGLISIESRRGAYVRRFSLKEVRDLYDLRGFLEVQAVKLAHVSPGLLRDLAESIKRIREQSGVSDMMAHLDEDTRFHGLIAAATGNNELCRVLENINRKSILCRSKSFHLIAWAAAEFHNGIFLALKDGDKDLAQQAMHHHILSVRDALLDLLRAEETNSDSAENNLLVASPR